MAVSEAQPTIPSSSEPLRAKCGWIIALGVVYLVAGIVALSSVAFATAVTVFLVGVMMIVAGVAEVINAIQVKSWGKSLVWALLGLLYIVAGVLTFENPLLTAKFLTLLLGFFLLGRVDRAHGVLRRGGRLVEPPQCSGDRRPVQLQRGDRGGELGPDVGRHQVGQVARLGHEITLREERPSRPGRFARR